MAANSSGVQEKIASVVNVGQKSQSVACNVPSELHGCSTPEMQAAYVSQWIGINHLDWIMTVRTADVQCPRRWHRPVGRCGPAVYGRTAIYCREGVGNGRKVIGKPLSVVARFGHLSRSLPIVEFQGEQMAEKGHPTRFRHLAQVVLDARPLAGLPCCFKGVANAIHLDRRVRGIVIVGIGVVLSHIRSNQ